MSSYLVLARKYRPQQFPDIVGQGSVVKTLMNSIRLNRVHHAFIFSGSRGIGKTSIARIFARALRCENTQEKNGVLLSCGTCTDCKEISLGQSMNVTEVDGASNNGVDEIREIRENVRYMPSSGRYRIYIIDEVHMLTSAAFNALLKTLEEPPEHVIFIFATTEVHKIPETILGRCQRFDFQRATQAELVSRMEYVLGQEKIPYEAPALIAIARSAEGSMRDALSILDQVISFSGLQVTLLSVRESLGILGQERVSEIVHAVLARDVKRGLELSGQAFDAGVDLKEILKGIVETLYAVILLKVGVTPQNSMTEDEIQWLGSCTPLRELEEIELIFQLFNHGLDWVSRSPHPKILFDTILIKATLAEGLTPVGQTTDVEEVKQPVAAQARPVSAQGQQALQQPLKVPEPVPAKTQTLTPPTPAKAPVQRERTWEDMIQSAFAQAPVVSVLLESAVRAELPTDQKRELNVYFKNEQSAIADQLKQKAFRESMNNFLVSYFGYPVVVNVSASETTGESIAERTKREEKNSYDLKLKAVHSHPVIQEAKSLFGADLTALHFTDEGSGAIP